MHNGWHRKYRLFMVLYSRHVVMELLTTEQVYVQELRTVIEVNLIGRNQSLIETFYC